MKLDRGDKVRIFKSMGVQGVRTGIITAIDGEYVHMVLKLPFGRGSIDIEVYRCEVEKVISKGNVVPLTQRQLNQLIADAEPETLERHRRRANAQIKIQRLTDEGILKLGPNLWPPVLA